MAWKVFDLIVDNVIKIKNKVISIDQNDNLKLDDKFIPLSDTEVEEGYFLVKGQDGFTQSKTPPVLRDNIYKKIYVDAANGDDTNTGNYGEPLKTFEAALDVLQEIGILDTVYIMLSDGDYSVTTNRWYYISNSFSIYGNGKSTTRLTFDFSGGDVGIGFGLQGVGKLYVKNLTIDVVDNESLTAYESCFFGIFNFVRFYGVDFETKEHRPLINTFTDCSIMFDSSTTISNDLGPIANNANNEVITVTINDSASISKHLAPIDIISNPIFNSDSVCTNLILNNIELDNGVCQRIDKKFVTDTFYTHFGFGDTSERPASPVTPFMYYDTDLEKPMWWSGDKWLDANTEDVEIVITVGETVPTLQDAIDMTLGHGGQWYKILLPDGNHTAVFADNFNVDARIKMYGISKDKTKVNVELSGSSSSQWIYFVDDVDFRDITLNSTSGNPMFLSFIGGDAHILNSDIGNAALIPQSRCYLEIKECNTVNGAFNEVWAYENSYVEINTCELFRTHVYGYSFVNIFLRSSKLGGEDSDNMFSGPVITIRENAFLIRTNFTLQNADKGIALYSGATLKNAAAIDMVNITNRFNIEPDVFYGDGTYIALGETPIVFDGHSGPTSSRPGNPKNGLQYFDEDIGKPIWYQDGDWKDAAGNIV